MPTITFDTLELASDLRAAGIPQAHADTLMRVLAKSRNDLVTREYLDSVLAPIILNLVIVNWKTNALIASNLVIISLLIKLAF